jgi:hypothetical protein
VTSGALKATHHQIFKATIRTGWNAAKTRKRKMYEDEIETLFDRIAEGRKSLRVFHTKPQIETGETFVISFLLNVEAPLYTALCTEAERRKHRVEKTLRQYISLCFKKCIGEVEAEDEQQKAA